MGHRRALIALAFLSAVALAALLVAVVHFIEPLIAGDAPGRALADIARVGDARPGDASVFVPLVAVHLLGVMVLAPIGMMLFAHVAPTRRMRRVGGAVLLSAAALATLGPYIVLPPPAQSPVAALAVVQVAAVLAGAAAGVVAAAAAARGESLGETVAAPLARAAPAFALAGLVIVGSAFWEWSLFLSLSAS